MKFQQVESFDLITKISRFKLILNSSERFYLNCFELAYFHVPNAILFEFSPFLNNSTRVSPTNGPTDRRTDGQTHPLIEMRERI